MLYCCTYWDSWLCVTSVVHPVLAYTHLARRYRSRGCSLWSWCLALAAGSTEPQWNWSWSVFSRMTACQARCSLQIRIHLLACRNLLWDILRLPNSCRAALGLYVILTLWRARGANQLPYALLHRSSPRYALHHGRRQMIETECQVKSITKFSWAFFLGSFV